MPKNILLVDDDRLLRRSLAFNLEQAGYRVNSAANAEDGLAVARREQPDLVILDIGLPGMDGLDAIGHFKSEFGVPVIFLTARRRNLDEVVGLEIGADDYITKPFDVDVLLAHVKAVLRRSAQIEPESSIQSSLTVGDVHIDPSAHKVTVKHQEVGLSPREFDLLYALALQPERVFSVDELLNRIWGTGFIGQPQVVYVHIRWLREKIEDDPNNPQRIVTVRRVGYKLVPVNKDH